MLDNSVISTKKIVLSIWLLCWIALLLCMLLSRKFMIALFGTFYFLFLVFFFNWLMRNYDILWICAEWNYLFVHKETFIIPAVLDFIRLNISHLIKAMHLFYFFGFFIYLFTCLFIFWSYSPITESLNFYLSSLASYSYRFVSFMKIQAMVLFIFLHRDIFP